MDKRTRTLLIFAFVILFFLPCAAARDDCPDYCSRDVRYYHGTMTRSVCIYETERCDYGCDGDECAEASCDEYCEDGTHYSNGRTSGSTRCAYDTEECANGCDSRGVSCAAAQIPRDCPDHCERGVYFYDGTYTSSGCAYESERCSYGCDSEECAQPADCRDYCQLGVFYSNGVPGATDCVYEIEKDCTNGCHPYVLGCLEDCPPYCKNGTLHYDGVYKSGGVVMQGYAKTCVYKEKTCYAGCAADGQSCNLCTSDTQCPDGCKDGWFNKGHCANGVCTWISTPCQYGCALGGLSCKRTECTSGSECSSYCANGTYYEGACTYGKCEYQAKEVCNFGCNNQGTACSELCSSNTQCAQYCDPNMGSAGRTYWSGKCDIGTKSCVYNQWEDCKYGCNNDKTACKLEYVADVGIKDFDAVQVIYDVPLVQGKNTVFRVVIDSQFTMPVSVDLFLELDEDEWWVPENLFVAGSKHFNGIEIQPGKNEIFLPIEKDDAPFDTSKPTLVTNLLDGEHISSIYPDIRLLPRPTSDTASARISLTELNHDAYEGDELVYVKDTNTGNNIMESGDYEVIKTRNWKFLLADINDSEGCIPFASLNSPIEKREAHIKKEIGFLHGLFPIAEDKISFAYSPIMQNWGPGVKRSDFLKAMQDLATTAGYDFFIGFTCGGAGGASGTIKAVFIGHWGSISNAAHEYNHVVVDMRDLYGLDCLVGWDQAYCDYMNTSRAYCSYNDAEVNTGPYCWIDSNLNNIYCDDNEYDRSDLTVGDCGPKGNADETKCKELCQNVTNCTGHGGKVYGGPDGRAVHRASKGFWANNMTAITDTEDMSPIRYMMDSNSTGNWPDYWMVRENTIKHCTGDVNTDGYMNLLNIFEDEADPEILVVRGRITRDGIASFDPFINIGNGTLDPLFKEDGDYRIVLIDGNGNLLAAYGFDVSFYMSDPDGGLIDEAAFAHKVGWKAGTTRMELRDRNGAVLAARAVSLNKPQVEITAPKDDVSGREAVIDVRWTAADEDGDSMSYSIALSADSGGTWIPLAVDLLEKKYALDASILQNGDYLVRVLATDGVNTGSAVSEFSIRAKSPAGPVAPATQHGGVQLQTVLIAVVLLLLAAVAATLVFIKKRRSQRPVV